MARGAPTGGNSPRRPAAYVTPPTGRRVWTAAGRRRRRPAARLPRQPQGTPPIHSRGSGSTPGPPSPSPARRPARRIRLVAVPRHSVDPRRGTVPGFGGCALRRAPLPRTLTVSQMGQSFCRSRGCFVFYFSPFSGSVRSPGRRGDGRGLLSMSAALIAARPSGGCWPKTPPEGGPPQIPAPNLDACPLNADVRPPPYNVDTNNGSTGASSAPQPASVATLGLGYVATAGGLLHVPGARRSLRWALWGARSCWRTISF